ncbi:MAG: histidine kinase [Staphylococcus equorum]|mgnify:CR=1 FL=1|nr:histidine kinase [Staphylococcus equorum]
MGHGDNRLKGDVKMTLQRTTLLMLIILLLFFSMMFMIATSIISKKTEDDFKIRSSETAVNNVVSTIEANLVNYNYLSRLIMVNDKVVSYLKAEEIDRDMIYEPRRGIYEIKNLYSYIDSVYIFRNDGEYVSTGRGEYFININSLERSNILDARGTAVVSINANGTIRKSSGKPLLTMSRAVYDINSQKLLGILIMNISDNVFDDTLSLQNSFGMCILDSDGTLLCGNEEIGALYDSDYNSDSIVYKNIHLGGERKILTGKLAVKPLVVLCVSGEGVESLPRETIYALMLTLIAFILSALVCTWFITVNIARPIRNLSVAMERTKSSGWLKKIDAKMPNNEIGRLAESYNRMIEYLNELFNRLLEDEENMLKAEMRVLQEQIKPHFLYNTLETISYMAVQENASKVHDALETLGSFYRNFLSKGDHEIPLKRELRITQDYLSLQKLRYGNIFKDEYIIDDSTLDCMIPKLILQPLVENSIYHGVRLKGEKCVIRITTRMVEGGLYIIVYDSGVGMSTEQIKKVLEANEENDVRVLSGFGLRGTINRIRYYYDCNNVVQIRSKLGEYTEVEIYIPEMRELKVEGEV